MKAAAWRWSGRAVVLALAVVWLVLFRPTSLGGDATWLVIRGNSMLPVYRPGDLVVLRSAPTYAAGQIVAYAVPQDDIGEGQLIIHRLIGGDAASGFKVQGDNNPGLDPWSPTAHDIVGSEWFAIPGLGNVIAWIRQPATTGALASALIVSILVARQPGRASRLAQPVPKAPRRPVAG